MVAHEEIIGGTMASFFNRGHVMLNTEIFYNSLSRGNFNARTFFKPYGDSDSLDIKGKIQSGLLDIGMHCASIFVVPFVIGFEAGKKSFEELSQSNANDSNRFIYYPSCYCLCRSLSILRSHTCN